MQLRAIACIARDSVSPAPFATFVDLLNQVGPLVVDKCAVQLGAFLLTTSVLASTQRDKCGRDPTDDGNQHPRTRSGKTLSHMPISPLRISSASFFPVEKSSSTSYPLLNRPARAGKPASR